MFLPLDERPDHPSIEVGVLDYWDKWRIFDKLRAKNEAGPKFSFIDGPVTANKTLGVHTAWGRTLKDVYQRYKALRGFHQRYQNGFDCQGLWIEVGVEKKLGLNSKRDIEEYGLAAFARECRSVVEWSVDELRSGSKRLGQWMDWGNDYLTSADGNIEYIWKFLKTVHDRGWLYQGQRATEWCPRCGTSISSHELIGSYIDLDSPSVRVRFPLVDRPGENLLIWTTTPWTLPANVAAAVNEGAQYGRLANGDWVIAQGDFEYLERLTGASLVGWRYNAPFEDLPAAANISRVVVGWDEVATDEGTGIVHIAPGCGTDDFALGQALDLPVLTPVDESGRYYDGWGEFSGKLHSEVTESILEYLSTRDLLAASGTLTHRYPECWRCHTPLIYRVSDDWFISVNEIREPMREANRTVEWTPSYMGLRMDDWLVNMSDWNISRRRYYGLPLPIYPCMCGHRTIIGSRQELEELATSGLEQLEELRRPWIDNVRVRCEKCNAEVSRVPEVGDVWLDAGIVPFSTLGWESPEHMAGGMATGAAAGLTGADLPSHEEWKEWFPADWVSEMREQIRLWFYSQLFISVALVGKAPYKKVLGYEKLLDETGREMHGSWGNMMSAADAFDRMGADIMRWMYASQPANQDLLFGYTQGEVVRAKFLTLWNSAKFFIQNANVNGYQPTGRSLKLAQAEPKNELDRWLIERTNIMVRDAEKGYESYATSKVIRTVEEYLDDLSNWYIRLSRRRFWDGEQDALQSLHTVIVALTQVMAPIVPFYAEYLWQHLVRDHVEGAPESVFLSEWPQPGPADAKAIQRMRATRAIVELGRQARAEAKHRVRQPLRSIIVDGMGANEFLPELVRDELRVKEVRIESVPAAQTEIKLNYRVLGKRLGPAMQGFVSAFNDGRYEETADGGILVEGERANADELFKAHHAPAGWAVASDKTLAIALDTELDDELVLEGRANDLARAVNALRREHALEITDRIHLNLPMADADLAAYSEMIADETLAVSITFDSGQLPELVKA